MSEKGLAYIRTHWAYGERPVTAEKLNAWDGYVADALELTWLLINEALGGGDGVLPGLWDGLHVVALTPAALGVRVLPGCAFLGGMPFKLAEAVDTLPLEAPGEHPRIDLVQARLADWSIVVKEGLEAETPEAPPPTPGCLALAAIWLRPGMTAIANTDDGVNGYIEDVRDLLAG